MKKTTILLGGLAAVTLAGTISLIANKGMKANINNAENAPYSITIDENVEWYAYACYANTAEGHEIRFQCGTNIFHTEGALITIGSESNFAGNIINTNPLHGIRSFDYELAEGSGPMYYTISSFDDRSTGMIILNDLTGHVDMPSYEILAKTPAAAEGINYIKFGTYNAPITIKSITITFDCIDRTVSE